MTSGRGEFQMALARYDELPAHLSEKIIKESKVATQGESKDKD
jgi:translation elongation factor EF-G